MVRSIKSGIGMCDCARTKEFCVTRGCKRDAFEWRYATEGRDQDHLRRIIDTRRKGNPPASRWIRPERAIAEAWLMNLEARGGTTFILKLGPFAVDTAGVP